MSAHIQRAQLLLQQSRHELAEKELRQALAENPNEPIAHALLALCLAHQQKFADANREARSALHLGPDESFCHYAMASVLQGQEKLKEAQASIEEAIRLDPLEANYFALLSNLEFQMRRWEEALRAAEQGLELDAEHVTCTNLRAMALMKLGRKEEAGTTIDAALRREPENAVTHANQGWTLLQQGQHESALEHFREALRLDPELEWAREGIVEALKARHIVYRVMLQYFFWMSRLQRKAQWALILGAFFGARIIRGLANSNPEWGPVLWPLYGLYVVFALMTWVAAPLFNLLLRLNRFGRLALSRDQIVASNWIGLCFLAAIVMAGLAFGTKTPGLLLAAIGCGLMVIPVAGTFNCPVNRRKPLMIYLIALAAVGSVALALALVSPKSAAMPATVFFLGVFLFQWVAIARATRY